MKIRKLISASLMLTLMTMSFSNVFAASNSVDVKTSQQENKTAGGYSLNFDPNNYTVKTTTLNGQTITYRAYEKIVYVRNPVDINYEIMNIYIPVEYFEGKTIGSYTAETAPIFFPNTIGGYMPGAPGSPDQTGFVPGAFAGRDTSGDPGAQAPTGDTTGTPTGQAPAGQDQKQNAALVALSKGYVVAEPGARGRTTQDANGIYTGKAPACIVDLKAAVRYLRYNDRGMPGDAEKIISNGTSAGGAVSALLGATGNNKDYEPYLRALGAADERDDIFAASCYCPITNLDNADMAYEWLFNGINDYNDRGTQKTLTDAQIKLSNELKAMFPVYLNSLKLKNDSRLPLTLDENGNGTFKDYVKSFVIASAQKALDGGKDLSEFTWMTIKDGKVKDIDFDKYVQYATRMKATPAFDGVDLSTGENDLFGTATVKAQHYTKFSYENSTVGGTLADASIVKMMNPMNYIGTRGTTTTQNWRIRHGAVDRDTSLAVPVILATKLENKGYNVDFAAPWGQGHGGDYDLDELFAWIGEVCDTTAHPTNSDVIINGKKVPFDAYKIKDNNYFKLRDIAMAISGSTKQFEVTWDEAKNAINLTSNKAYTKTGNELLLSNNPTKGIAAISTSKLYMNGEDVQISAFNINGNNYFKLRDIAEALNFNVTWDEKTNTIIIDTTKGFTEGSN